MKNILSLITSKFLCCSLILSLCFYVILLLKNFDIISLFFDDISRQNLRVDDVGRNVSILLPEWRHSFSTSRDLGTLCNKVFHKHCPASIISAMGITIFSFPFMLPQFRYLSYNLEYGNGMTILYYILSQTSESPNILIIGGGVGHLTLFTLKFRPKASITVLNPHPTHRLVFKENLGFNNISMDNIQQLPLALSDESNQLATSRDISLLRPFYKLNQDNDPTYRPLPYSTRTITISSLLARIKSPNFIIIDAPEAEIYYCNSLNSHYSQIELVYIVTYSIQGHSQCLAMLSIQNMTIIEESKNTNQRLKNGKFGSSNYGVLAAVFPEMLSKKSKLLSPLQIFIKGIIQSTLNQTTKSTAMFTTSQSTSSGSMYNNNNNNNNNNHIIVHQYPYNFTNKNNIDYTLVQNKRKHHIEKSKS